MGSISLQELKEKGLIWLAQANNVVEQYHNSPKAISFKIPEIDLFLPFNGIPRGSINEWYCEKSFAPFSFFTRLAAEQINSFSKPVIWIEESMWPLPHFLFESSQSSQLLEKSFFIKTRSSKEKLWLIDEATKTKGVGLVIANGSSISDLAIKKIAIAVRESGAVLLLVQDKKNYSNSSIFSKWDVSFSPNEDTYPHFNLKLVKYKGLNTENLHWTVRFKKTHAEVVNHNRLQTDFSSEEKIYAAV